jgi:hypothetical protein
MPEKKKKRRNRKSDEARNSEQFTTRSDEPKRGRPTTPDNVILRARNAWVALLEEFWFEIGLQMRDMRAWRKATIEDIRKLFEPVKQKFHNSDLVTSFHHKSTDRANTSEILRNRKRVGKLDAQIRQTRAKRHEQQRACQIAEVALKQSTPGHDRDIIQSEAIKRLRDLTKIEDELKTLQSERKALENKLRDQEAYINRSELLEFLLSARYAINPRNVANALAGLPGMKWRQSYTRCSHMSYDADARSAYRVLEVISHIWARRLQEFEAPPIDFFRCELLTRSRKSDPTRQFIRQRWTDLKLAIVECWNSERLPSSIPSFIAKIFMRNVARPKNAAEQILAEQESLKV